MIAAFACVGVVLFGTVGALPILAQYRPFLVPLHLGSYWLVLLLPLVVAIAITYKCIKLDELSKLPREAIYMAAQIIGFMIVAALALWLSPQLL